MRKNVLNEQTGFTITELMIATLIFSVILIVVTYVVLQIGHNYYKGAIQSRTQDTARSILDSISRDIQVSGGLVVPNVLPNGLTQGFCVNNRMYSFVTGLEVNTGGGSSSSYHGMVVSSSNSCSNSTQTPDINLASGVVGAELLSPNMRLAKMSVIETDVVNNIYQINIRLVYGDDDLLCSPIASDCTNTTNNFISNYNSTGIPADLTCKSQTGGQFCAVSELTATVQQRFPS